MADFERFGMWGDHHPIDLAQSFACEKNWQMERLTDDRVSMIIEGVWQHYSVNVDFSSGRESLNLICAFDMDPNESILPSLYETLNLINGDEIFGAFSFWREQQLLVYQNSVSLCDGALVSKLQLEQMLLDCVQCCDTYYPVFQLVGWAKEQPSNAIQMAFPAAAGRA